MPYRKPVPARRGRPYRGPIQVTGAGPRGYMGSTRPRTITVRPMGGRRQPTINLRPSRRGVFGTIQHSGSQAARAAQTFVRNRGYHVKIDGNIGPHTRAAIAAMHNNVHPAKFNAVSRRGGTIRTANGPINVPQSSFASRAGAIGAGLQAPQTDLTTLPTVAGTDTSGGDMLAGFDPVAAAQAQIAAVYGPQEAALQQQMAAAQAAGEAGAKNLNTWYGDVANTNQAATQSNLEGTQALLGAEGAADANILQLFGGPQANPGAGEAAAYTGINRAELANTGEAQQGFDTAMAPIIGIQKTDALKANQGQTAANLADLNSQMSALQASKAQDYQSALQQAYQQQQDAASQAQQDALAQAEYQLKLEDTQRSWQHQDLVDAAARQNMDIIGALAPGKLKAQGLANKDVASRIHARNQAANLAAQKFGVSKVLARASLDRTNAYITKTRQAMNLANQPANWNDPTTLGTLQDNARGVIAGSRGGFRLHPGLAQQNLNTYFASIGVPRAVAQRVGSAMMIQAINNSHANGQWRDFGVRNGRVVRVRRRVRKK